MNRLLALAALAAALAPLAVQAAEPPTIRVATYNTSLNDDAGQLIARFEHGDDHARKVAAVIQHVRPDLILLNEFDFDAEGRAAELFVERYLGAGQFGEQPIEYRYRYLAPVNTGVPSGMDLDRNGRIEGGNDAWGFGRHPGQYGMLVLSKFPIDTEHARTFQNLRWATMPGALRPMLTDGSGSWYPDAVWNKLRLSSKSHWDLPVATPLGTVHFLVSHPTPPVFDGPEDRNGLRNHDEIRLWAEYLDNDADDADWLVDDTGAHGGLPADQAFVMAGDQNADPVDGDGYQHAMLQLLQHPRVLRYPLPRSVGAYEARSADGGANLLQLGDPANDTGAFGAQAGNLHLDYVLPSTGFEVRDSGVFWPAAGAPGRDWVDASDHRLVWIDLARSRH